MHEIVDKRILLTPVNVFYDFCIFEKMFEDEGRIYLDMEKEERFTNVSFISTLVLY